MREHRPLHLKESGRVDEANPRAPVPTNRLERTRSALPLPLGGLLPPDITFLLRCHAERTFLEREVAPRLARASTAEAEPLLRAVWREAEQKALATDVSFEALRAAGQSEASLALLACRYYNTVRTLRARLWQRAQELTQAAPD